ncbi:cysteine desulfurase [Alphaproteobacteria bacterium]|nr:cysteine desulfurase [PS1 clade bacterium]MBL6784401.1 cysteine desulfurase [PS1 clade bacterium]MDB2522730.1 cysteine desulfurase [Alphaproteobacteria bacterium]
MSRIYLDYNATAPLRPEARDALLAALDIGNPSSVHEEGRKARALVEAARADVASLVGAPAETVIFTSGGTEACNLALGLRQAPAGEIKRLLVSAIEHSAVLAAAKESGLPVEELPVTPDGVLDLDALDAALADDTPALVCVMLANNETGVIQPIAEVAAKTRAHGSLLFCDGVQAAGKIDINLFALGVDALSLSGHKLGAPMGVGALVTRPAVVVPPQLIGGGQELGRRAGSENISGIAAFAAAARAAMRDLQAFADLADRRDEMEAALQAAQAQLVVYGKGAPRLANTSCFALSGLNAETLVMAMDLAGISVSAGSACSSGKVSRSHVLAAMQAEPHISKGVLRVSLGWQSRAEDTQKLVNEWSKLAGQTLAAE